MQPGNQPLPDQNFQSSSSSNNALGQCGTNIMGVGQTMSGNSLVSELPQELGLGGSREHPGQATITDARQPQLLTPEVRGTHLEHRQTNTNKSWSSARLTVNHSLNSQSLPPVTQSWRKWVRNPGVGIRKVLLPTPIPNLNASVSSSQYGGNHVDAQHGMNRDVSQYAVNNPIMDGSLFGRNLSISASSKYVTNYPIPRGGEYVSDCPLPSYSTAGNRPVPDGTTYNLKYPAPDMKNLLFDSSTGYRFDPTTGLHFDANSGLYLNNRLKVLLRWEPVTSTYVLVSNNASGLAKPFVALMHDSRDSAGVSPSLGQSNLDDLEKLAREVAREVLLSRQKRIDETSLRRSDFHERIPRSQDLDPYHSLDRSKTYRRRARSPDFYSSHATRTRHSERESPIEDLRNRLGQELHRGYSPSSSPEHRKDHHDIIGQHDVRDGMRDYRRDRSFGRSRSPRRRSRSQTSIGNRNITEIYERNLRDVHNLYGRYFSMFPSTTPCILITPVQPRNVLKRSSVAELLEDTISSDGLDFRSVRVYQGGFGAPCNYALVQFYNEDDALFWYKLRRGKINLGPDYTTFLFLSEDHWVCQKQDDEDAGCSTPTPNFPFRTTCYKCLELRSKIESPIIMVDAPTQWIGICQLDSIQFSSITDVMSILPPHKGISVESAEFLREPSGIPIGLCVFQILDKEQASDFFTVLKKEKFNVSYVLLDKKALDSPALSHRSKQQIRLGNGLGQFDKDPVEQTSIEFDKKSIGSEASEQEGLTPTDKYMKLLPDDSPRQSHLPNTSPETIFGGHDEEEFAVIDDCKNEVYAKKRKPKPLLGGPFKKVKPFLGGPTNKHKPLLRGPMNQVIKDQIKNIDLLHSKNAEDPDNILRNLFVDTPALRPSILLSPIPRDKDLAMNELEKILISDGIESHCESIGIFRGKGLGAPADYALVHFYKPVKALSWYNENKALLCLNDGSNDKFKVFMFFSQDNWKCPYCTFTNFPLRNWCNRCLKSKNQNVFSQISESSVPTQLLGITLSGLPDNVPESSFHPEKILGSLHEEESKRVISCKMMLEDKGLPGLCVLETQDNKESAMLRKHLQSNGWTAFFVQVHNEPWDLKKFPDSLKAPDSDKPRDSGNESESENTSSLSKPTDADKASELDEAFMIAQPQPKNTALVKCNNRKNDLLKFIFDSSQPSPYIILSPVPRIKWLTLKQHLEDMFLKDGLNSSCSFDVCRPEMYGSSQAYIQVCFTDSEKAESWHNKHKGVLELLFPATIMRKEIKSQMHMYYAGGAWSCQACSAENFPARSLCHKCYAHRDEDGFTPVTISNTPTKWVGISCLRPSIANVDQVKKVLPPLGGFYIMRMQFMREPNPLMYLGLCVIEAPTEKRAVVLAEYVKKHPALEYNNEKNAKVIFVNLNRRSGEDSYEQDSMVNSDQNDSEDALALLCSSVAQDGTFTLNDSASNFHLWWENLRNSVAEGEDFLKNLFEQQVFVPLPAGDSVFVPLPAGQQSKGSQAEQTGQPVGFHRKLYGELFERDGVNKEIAEQAKLYFGKCVGSPCSYTILTFETASEAVAWRTRHNGRWVIDMGGGFQWTSFLHSSDPNWTCEKCNTPNFPLRLYCFCCFDNRSGGAPLVTISDTPTRFVGITKFQNWCASEEILFESIKVLPRMKENQQLKQVHYITEPSGISLGLCVLELENLAIARTISTHLLSITRRMQNIIYVELNSQ